MSAVLRDDNAITWRHPGRFFNEYHQYHLMERLIKENEFRSYATNFCICSRLQQIKSWSYRRTKKTISEYDLRNRRPMYHIAHARNKHICAKLYDYIITLIKRVRAKCFIFKEWNSPLKRWVLFTLGCFVPYFLGIGSCSGTVREFQTGQVVLEKNMCEKLTDGQSAQKSGQQAIRKAHISWEEVITVNSLSN